MSYKIAVASSNEIQIDETFGSAKIFIIFEVADQKYHITEERAFQSEDLSESYSPSNGCDNSNGCGSGCGGSMQGSAKVDLIADCRCVVCKKNRLPHTETS